MNNLDLRQVGTVLGLPVYIDVSQVPNIEVGAGALKMTERDRKIVLVRTIFERVFSTSKQKPMPRRITVHIDAMLFTPHGGYKRLKRTFTTDTITPKQKYVVDLGRTMEPNRFEVLLEEMDDYND